MYHPKVGKFYDKSTYFKTPENHSLVFEGICLELKSVFYFLLEGAFLDIFKVSQLLQKDKCPPSILCVYTETHTC